MGYSWLVIAPLAFFLPIVVPIRAADRLSPVANLTAIVAASGCTEANLGPELPPANCINLITTHHGFVAVFDWHESPCGSKHCADATNFQYARKRNTYFNLYQSDRSALDGRHAFAVDYGNDEPACVDVRAVAGKRASALAGICVYRNPSDAPKR